MRNQKIQILRSLAIIAVVLIHTCNGGYWQVCVRPFINFAVALFIFLSGYLTKTENDNWLLFFKRRISRVAIPYVIWTVIYTFPSSNIKEYIFNLLTTQASPTLYYIFVYIQFVLLTPFLAKLSKSKYNWVGFLIAPISILGYKYSVLIFDLYPSEYLNICWDVSCLGWFTYYYLGLLLGNVLVVRKYKWVPLLVLYGLSIVLQMLEGYFWYECFKEPNCGTQVKLSVLITCSIFCLIAYKYLTTFQMKFNSSLLVLIGDYSFGIYLVHILIMKVLWRFVSVYSSLPFFVNSIVVLFISIVVVSIGRKICGNKLSRWVGFC